MADSIKIGNLNISAFKVGSGDCKIFLGTTQLYPQGTPTFEGKFKLEYSDSSVYSAECDSTSAVTSGEVRSNGSTAITSVIIGECVTEIGNGAFQLNNAGGALITSITVPHTVTTVGQRGFRWCNRLTSLDLSNVTSIGERALQSCTALTSVTLSNDLTHIYQMTFDACKSLPSITLPSGLTAIDYAAFYVCSGLTSIDIPSGVTSIGNQVFQGCTSLTAITVNATTPPTLGYNVFLNTNDCPIYVPCSSLDAYIAASGWSDYASRIQGIPPCDTKYRTISGTPYCSGASGYDKYVDVYSQVSYDGGTTWETTATTPTLVESDSEDCGYVYSYKLQATYNDSSTYKLLCDSTSAVTSGEVRSHTTSYTAMTNAIIGDCVTSIDEYSFADCTSLTSVTIPNGVGIINYQTFANCYSLTSITIPSGVTIIDRYAFYGCSGLTSIDIPSGVTSIGDSAFYGCTSLTSITVNATTPPTLSSDAFGNTNICPIYVPCESVVLYKNANRWSEYAFRITTTNPSYAERWTQTSDTMCEDGDLYYVDVLQYTCDGTNYTSTSITRKGNLIEEGSSQCSVAQSYTYSSYEVFKESGASTSYQSTSNGGITVTRDSGNIRIRGSQPMCSGDTSALTINVTTEDLVEINTIGFVLFATGDTSRCYNAIVANDYTATSGSCTITTCNSTTSRYYVTATYNGGGTAPTSLTLSSLGTCRIWFIGVNIDVDTWQDSLSNSND